MIISHRHRFVLLAPWKAASTTAHEMLAPYNESPYSRFFELNTHLQRVVHQHLTLADFLALPEAGLGYKVGAFVRNPYDRAYSGFTQLLRDIGQQPASEFPAPWIGDLVRTQLADNARRIIAAGYDFNRWMLSVPEHETREVGRNSSMPLHPAHYWTHVGGTRRVDFIGKVETFAIDFRRWCDLVGVPTPELVRANATEGGGDYLSRMSREAMDRIGVLFAADFELSGYARK